MKYKGPKVTDAKNRSVSSNPRHKVSFSGHGDRDWIVEEIFFFPRHMLKAGRIGLFFRMASSSVISLKPWFRDTRMQKSA